jgi:predicted ATPase
LDLAEKFRDLARRGSDPVEPLIGARMMGFSLHYLGDQTAARRHLEETLRGYDARVQQSDIVRFQSDQRVRARTRLAVVLWLQGYPDRAMQAVEESVAEAMAGGHAGTLASALAQGACRVALACGDLVAASRFVEMLLAHSARRELRFLHALGRCFEGTLLVKQGEVDRGSRLLRDSMNEPSVAGHGLWFTSFLCDLGDACGLAGDTATGLATLEGALERTEQLGEGWCRAELLHLKGRLTFQRGLPGDADRAASLLRQSLDIATDQATLSWELRSATSLARIWRDTGRVNEAGELLMSAYGRFTEGFSTADLRAARALLDEIAQIAR